MGIVYCKKCGLQSYEFLPGKEPRKCSVCGSIMDNVPETITLEDWLNGDGKKAVEEKLVKTSPEFDPYLFEHRDEILHKHNEEWDRKMAIGQARLNGMSAQEALDTNGQGYKNKPTCPTCGSTNVQKISAMSKVIGASMFGLFSKTAKSQFKCNNCGYKW